MIFYLNIVVSIVSIASKDDYISKYPFMDLLSTVCPNPAQSAPNPAGVNMSPSTGKADPNIS